MADSRVGATDAGTRLDKFLASPDRAGSRARAAAALARGKVFVTIASDALPTPRRVSPPTAVRLWMDRPGTRETADRLSATIAILAECTRRRSARSCATSPRASWRAAPAAATARDRCSTIRSRILRRAAAPARVVHRIDRDTSGLVLFAKTAAAQETLQAQFKRREPERVYLAVVYGLPSPPSRTWRDTLVWDTGALIQKESEPARSARQGGRSTTPRRGSVSRARRPSKCCC